MVLNLPGPGIGVLRDALAAAGSQYAAMLEQVTDPSRPAIGEWSVGETAAHVASSAPFFLRVARGEAEPEVLGEVAAHNAAVLAADPERDPRSLAERARVGETALLTYVAQVGGDPDLELFQGAVVPLSTLLAVELAEVLVHGYDIARASGLAWPMVSGQAAAAAGGVLPLLPHLVDRRAAAGRRLRYELRIRGGERAVLDFDDGTLGISRSVGQGVDCRLSVDPAAYLLISFARIGVLRPMLQGKLSAWGRRPWLGVALPRLFRRV